jgi:hypothetical protein
MVFFGTHRFLEVSAGRLHGSPFGVALCFMQPGILREGNGYALRDCGGDGILLDGVLAANKIRGRVKLMLDDRPLPAQREAVYDREIEWRDTDFGVGCPAGLTTPSGGEDPGDRNQNWRQWLR